MKRVIYSLMFSIVTTVVFGQVAIGKESIDGASTILDFDSSATNTSGIILPAVEISPIFNIIDPAVQSPNNGTFVFDKTLQQIRMFENNAWVDLSGAGDKSDIEKNISLENNQVGVVIGENQGNATGVLILESADKAMILPKINRPHENVKNPYPGMICYDTESRSLAVFDGLNWNYWK